MKIGMRMITNGLILLLLIVGGIFIYRFSQKVIHEREILKGMIARLSADTRVAEVLVTGVHFDERSQKTFTTIKFLEYDVGHQPLKPRYFTFSGNIIQFQSLVIRFDDIHIKNADRLRGKSAYLFWKVFMLDGENTQEHEIAKIGEIPEGYKLPDGVSSFEDNLWKDFWTFALDSKQAKSQGIKSAQIEAPGTMFVPGNLYTIKIEHNGGLRIDATPLPLILQGETILKGDHSLKPVKIRTEK